jgi:hypothetical protein
MKEKDMIKLAKKIDKILRKKWLLLKAKKLQKKLLKN